MAFVAPADDLVVDNSQGGGSAASIAPATSQPSAVANWVAPADERLDANGHNPVQAGYAYLDAAGDGLPASIDQSLPWQQQAEAHHQAAKAYWNQNPLERVEDTVSQAAHHPLTTVGQAWDATSNAAGNLYARAKQGTADAWHQTAQDLADHPLRAPIDLLASATVGGLQGLYNLGKFGTEAVGKVTDAASGLVPAAGGNPESAARYRAYRNHLLRSYNSNVEAPTEANIRTASPLPAVQDVAENVVPAFVPIAGEEGMAAKAGKLMGSALPKVTGRVLQGTGKLGEVVADNAPTLSKLDAVHAVWNGGLLHAAGDLAAGTAAKYAKPLTTSLKGYGAQLAASGPSALVEQAAVPLLKGGLRTGAAAIVDEANVPTQQPWSAPPEELVAP